MVAPAQDILTASQVAPAQQNGYKCASHAAVPDAALLEPYQEGSKEAFQPQGILPQAQIPSGTAGSAETGFLGQRPGLQVGSAGQQRLLLVDDARPGDVYLFMSL